MFRMNAAMCLCLFLSACELGGIRVSLPDAAVDSGTPVADLGRDSGVVVVDAGKVDAGRPNGVCLPGQLLTDAAQVAALANTQNWLPVGPYSSTRIPVSDDFIVQGTLVLDSPDFVPSQQCLARQDCRHEVGFIVKSAPGATVPAPQSSWTGDSPSVTLTNTTVRFRFVERDFHPGPFNFVPMIEILPACETSCAANELTCAADNVCYSANNPATYCRLCLEKGRQECACWTNTGAAPNGTKCTFAESGDMLRSGTCQTGRCVVPAK